MNEKRNLWWLQLEFSPDTLIIQQLRPSILPVRPGLNIFFSRLEDQINKNLIGGICWKWRWIRVNAPKSVSSKSMCIKRTKIWKLHRQSASSLHQNNQSTQARKTTRRSAYLWKTYWNSPTNCFWRLKYSLQKNEKI